MIIFLLNVIKYTALFLYSVSMVKIFYSLVKRSVEIKRDKKKLYKFLFDPKNHNKNNIIIGVGVSNLNNFFLIYTGEELYEMVLFTNYEHNKRNDLISILKLDDTGKPVSNREFILTKRLIKKNKKDLDRFLKYIHDEIDEKNRIKEESGIIFDNTEEYENKKIYYSKVLSRKKKIKNI